MKNMKRIVFVSLVILSVPFSIFGQIFEKKLDYPKIGYAGVAFNSESKVYFGAGIGNKSLWEYDPASDNWTAKGDIPGITDERAYGVGVSIGLKAYVGLGYDKISNLKNDWWEFDFITNLWHKKADFPGIARDAFAYFALNGKIYVGGGADRTTSHSEFYEYDPGTDIWTYKGELPSGPISFPTCFTIDNKGYMVGGRVSSAATNQVYEYDPISNTWNTKAAFPGAPRQSAISFVAYKEGYVGHGTDYKTIFNDLYKYNPGLDTWTLVSATNNPSARCWLPAANIGNKAYLGTGCTSFSPFTFTNEFYEFTISSSKIINDSFENNEIAIFPNPTNATIQIGSKYLGPLNITIKDLLGNTIINQELTLSNQVDISSLSAQIYIVHIKNEKGLSVTRRILKQ